MPSTNVKTLLFGAWVTAVCLAAIAVGITSIPNWVLVACLAVVPPLVVRNFWRAPEQTISRKYRRRSPVASWPTRQPSRTSVDHARPPGVPGPDPPARRSCHRRLLAAVGVVLCIPLAILIIGIPIALCVRFLLWIVGML